MASLLTEIYVSIDGLTYIKLDLYKDESFTMKSSKKDLQDITKVFAPFSQDFTFPATPKNKKALGFFGNTQVIKINPDNKYFCKIYNNGQLNQKGLLKVRSVKYKEDKADSFTGSFNTELLSLKDRIGDDTLNDLTTADFSISWKPDNVYNTLRNTQTVTASGITLKTYTPLWSNYRVLKVESDIDPANDIDNVFYRTSSNPRKDKVLNIRELRPCVNMNGIMSLIKSKYNIPITIPLEAQPQMEKAFMWCNGNNFSRKYTNKFAVKKPFVNQDVTYLNCTNSLVDSSIRIQKASNTVYVDISINLDGLIIGDDNDKCNAIFTLINKADGKLLMEYDQELANGNPNVKRKIPLALFTSHVLEFYIYVKFDQPVYWKDSSVVVKANGGSSWSTKTSQLTNQNNIDDTGSHKLDLIQSLPDMKVIDFLQSYFKTFNISVFDSSPNDDNLFFLTPDDLNTPNKSYTKEEKDYTQFVDKKEVVKSVNNPYNYYSFRHRISNYRSNIDFKNQFDLEYGQAAYPLAKPNKPVEFKIETEFSIVPPIKIAGTNIFTCYGFDSSAPELINSNYFRYTPNLNETTIFISHGNTPISIPVGVQALDTGGNLYVGLLTNYVKSMPYCLDNLHTLSFSIINIDGTNYANSAYEIYYSQFIRRLLNPNALAQTYNITLPSPELYLNDAGVVSGAYLTSKGFRLQNDIIIGETKFEILESEIDYTTGKGKLKLLNY